MESLSAQITTIIEAVDDRIEQMEYEVSDVPDADRPAIQASLDALKTARATVIGFAYETDNEGQIVIYTGVNIDQDPSPLEDNGPRYFPTARIPLPSDEYVATHPEEYSYEEAGIAWARLDQETRNRLEREFEEREAQMSGEPLTEDDRWPDRPQHVR